MTDHIVTSFKRKALFYQTWLYQGNDTEKFNKFKYSDTVFKLINLNFSNVRKLCEEFYECILPSSQS